MLNGIFLTLSLISSVLSGALFINSFSDIWVAIVGFIGGYISLVILFFIFLLIFSLPISKKKEYNEYSAFYHYLFAYTIEYICTVCRIKLKINGLEKLPSKGDGCFVLAQNHRSKFDPMITFYALKKYPFAFISKPENFEIPLVGKYMTASGYIPINRESARLAIPAVKRAAKHVETSNYCVGLYPEGTRNLDNNELLPFHLGCLKTATLSKSKIVITTIDGTELVRKRAPFKRTVVTLDILEVIDSKDYLNTAEIAEKIKSVMQANLDKIKNN